MKDWLLPTLGIVLLGATEAFVAFVTSTWWTWLLTLVGIPFALIGIARFIGPDIDDEIASSVDRWESQREALRRSQQQHPSNTNHDGDHNR